MEEMQELSVQELSNRTGRSIQSIYKRIRNENDSIQGFLKRDMQGNVLEPVRIYENVIDTIYNKQNLTNKPKLNMVKVKVEEGEGAAEQQQNKTIYSKAFEVMQQQLNLLQEELKAAREEKQEKDKLIFELNNRLAESQRILDQQQQLNVIDKQKILQLEGQQQEKRAKKGLGIFALFRNREGANEQ